jgi:hypothetical protein
MAESVVLSNLVSVKWECHPLAVEVGQDGKTVTVKKDSDGKPIRILDKVKAVKEITDEGELKLILGALKSGRLVASMGDSLAYVESIILRHGKPLDPGYNWLILTFRERVNNADTDFNVKFLFGELAEVCKISRLILSRLTISEAPKPEAQETFDPEVA